MPFDNHKNFAYSLVATAPSPADSGTSLTVETGHGPRFPTAPFNATVWPVGDQPAVDNAEIVRITAVVGDVLTIARAQEGTSARSVVVGDQIAATITAKTMTDVEERAIWAQMWEAFDVNSDPVDRLIQSGAYRLFIFFSSHNASTWKAATNAVYTVPTGKKLIVLSRGAAHAVIGDTAFRQARFRNTTDSVDMLPPASFQGAGAYGLPWGGDLSEPSKMMEVVAGKQVRLELWNADASKRAMGAWVLCRELTP